MLTQGRGRGAVSQKHIMVRMFYILITCLFFFFFFIITCLDYCLRADKKKCKQKLFFCDVFNLFILCLQAAKEKQKIRAEEIQIDVVERKKEIEVEEKEVSRKDKELFATVRRPAEAESYRVETIAQGKRYAMV